jgi:hypothetical protein
VITLVLAIAVATGPSVAPQPFRFVRTLQPAGVGPVELIPDGAMFAHTRAGFGDLRIVDAHHGQVPWRPEPQGARPVVRALPMFDRGRRGGAVVARVRVGSARGFVDRVDLVVPNRRFVGSATVLGSDDGRTWTVLSTTQIYSVGGARPARSTTALLPRNDFRYLEVRATHVSRIDAVSIATLRHPPPLEPLRATVHVGTSEIVVDLGHRNVPVDELRISATTPRYDRPFSVLVGGRLVAAGRLARAGAARATVVPLSVRGRYLRIRVANGDNPPLRGIRVSVLARSRALLLEGGHAGPFTVYYGARIRSPVYDWARVPVSALALGRAERGTLGREEPNPLFTAVDRRSFFARHRSLVTAALALAAAVVLAAALLALRRG